MVQCKICGREFTTNNGMGGHITQKHKISTKQYYDEFLSQPGDGYCAICGKPTSFKSFNVGYHKHCSSCCHNTTECKEKRKNTNLIKYGVENVLSSDKIRKKAKETILKKYGSTEIFSTEHFKKKHKENSLIKYGTEYPIQNKEVYSKNKLGHYEYDNIKFDSSWELAVFIWHKNNNIDIVREPCQLKYKDRIGKNHTYFPDFKINNQLIEIKGNQYLDENGKLKDTDKQKCIEDNNVIVWSYNEIKQYITYCETEFSDRYWYLQFKVINPKKTVGTPKIKDNPMKCLICNKTFKNGNFLSSHLRFDEHIKCKDYYDKYLKKSNEGNCLVCGKPTRYINFTRGYQDCCSNTCNNSPLSNKGKNISKTKQEIKQNIKGGDDNNGGS